MVRMTMRALTKRTCLTCAMLCAPIICVLCATAAAEEKQPRLAPLPKQVPAPEENPTTPAKVALGKQLFFDPRLSGENQTSCATCHLPAKAWGDGLARARGLGEKTLARNTPKLLNVGFQKSLFWDGRAETLEAQALVPIQAADEMNQDLDELVTELSAVPGYARQFRAVFGGPVTQRRIAQALAAFQRTLVSRDSPLDRYLVGDEDALSPKAREGLELFVDIGCIRCHHGPLLSDGKFYRLGVEHRDAGRGGVTGKKDDRGKFRTPSLRDVARSGPYMHNGSKKTLFDVVEFYFRLVPTQTPDGRPLDIEPLLGQSYSDIDAIVAFLKSLSGEAHAIEPPPLP